MVTKLTYSALPPEIRKIANDSLGAGFLSALMGATDHTYHVIAKRAHDEFIGFSLFHFEDEDTRGVIDMVCVAPPYRKEGYGTLLTYGTMNKIAQAGAERTEILLKQPLDERDSPGVPLVGNEEMLLELGFRYVKTFDAYYEPLALREDYVCKHCGHVPDSCKALLYALDNL